MDKLNGTELFEKFLKKDNMKEIKDKEEKEKQFEATVETKFNFDEPVTSLASNQTVVSTAINEADIPPNATNVSTDVE